MSFKITYKSGDTEALAGLDTYAFDEDDFVTFSDSEEEMENILIARDNILKIECQ